MSGSGTGTIDGGSLEFESSVSQTQTIAFGANDGTLILTDPADFAASISGFGAGDTIDLASFAFGNSPTLSFVENGGGTQGVLTVTDDGVQAKLTLFGQYSAAGFGASNDGGGGTAITYTPPPMPGLHLAGPH